MSDKPHAPATERNRDAILNVLQQYLSGCASVLEIGSGTGQHAVHFAQALPQLRWQCSDRAPNLAGIGRWLADSGLANTPAALELDVSGRWPSDRFDAVFSANTLHIMAWSEVEQLFERLPGVIQPKGKLIIYGPFNYDGCFTSESNQRFDLSLRCDDPNRGIRDFEQVNALAERHGLMLLKDLEMPANNRCLIWQRAD